MRRFLLIVILFFTLSACKEEVKKPDNLIPRSEMKELLKDIYIYRQVKNYRISQNLPEISHVNLAVIEQHGFTLEQFKESYDYYVIDDAAYDELLTEIITDLEAELPEDSISQGFRKN